MPKSPTTISKGALVRTLKAESASLALLIDRQTAELEATKLKKSQIDATIAAYSADAPRTMRRTPRANAAARKSGTSIPPGSSTPGIFAGLSLQEACRKRLGIVGEPQTKTELWDALGAAGFELAASNPAHAVQWTMRKRQDRQGDVMLIGGGKWALKAWYSPEQIAQFEKNLGGMPGRERLTHSEKTKRGMALVRKRGVRLGAKLKVTDEVIERLRAHMASGDTAKEASARERISTQTFFLLRKKGVTGLDRLRGEARRRALAKRNSTPGSEAPDLLTQRTTGSVVH